MKNHKPKMVTYLITVPEEVSRALISRGAENSPFRSRKRQTEFELCQREGINLDLIAPMGTKRPDRRVKTPAKKKVRNN